MGCEHVWSADEDGEFVCDKCGMTESDYVAQDDDEPR